MKESIRTVLTRTRRFADKKYFLTAVSFVTGSTLGWSNCLYIHFVKEDFPAFKYPELVNCDWFGEPFKRFRYESSDASDLIMHWGCTFYEETVSVETGRTIVKIGCDYQHLYDDDYRARDSGEEILGADGDALAASFERIIEFRMSGKVMENADELK